MKKDGFLLVESVFELLLIVCMLFITIITFSYSVFTLKKVLNDIIDFNLKVSAAQEIINISKDEVLTVNYIHRTADNMDAFVYCDSSGNMTGFKYFKTGNYLSRYTYNARTREYGSTYISNRVNSFDYTDKFFSITFDEETDKKIKLYIP